MSADKGHPRGGTAAVPDPGTASADERNFATMDKALREGAYPVVFQRPGYKPGRIAPFPTLLLDSALFKYCHKVDHYTLQDPLVLKFKWGVVYYSGPALSPQTLSVVTAALQETGRQVMRGPRKMYSHLRIVGSPDIRKLDLEEAVGGGAVFDEYDLVDAAFGDTTLTKIAICAFGDGDSDSINRTRRELLKLIDARFAVHVDPEPGSRTLPEWLKIETKDEVSPDNEETIPVIDTITDIGLSVAMRRILAYDPENGVTSPMTVHRFFEPTLRNASRMTGGIGLVWSPFVTRLLYERATFLDLRLRQKLNREELALQLHSHICANTSRAARKYRRGFDKLINSVGFNLTYRKVLKGGVIREYLRYKTFEEDVQTAMNKLMNAGFCEWGQRLSEEEGRDTQILLVTRKFQDASDENPSAAESD